MTSPIALQLYSTREELEKDFTGVMNKIAAMGYAVDLVEKAAGRKLEDLLKRKYINPGCQIEHAERIGLGSSDYELIEIE